jgi:hypothetical protein
MKKSVILPKKANVIQAVKGLGVDLVDPVVSFIARLIPRVVYIDEDGDGKIEGGEIMNFAYKAGFDAFGTFRNFSWKDFAKQVKDADQEERAILISNFKEEFDLTDNEAEFLIEDWIAHLDRTAVLVSRTRALLSRNKKTA